MKKIFLTAAVLMCLAVAAFPAMAQNPTISVYFDEGFTQTEADCPGPGLDTLYVVAEDFDVFLIGFQYKIDLPPNMIWLADIGTPPVTIGTSVTGISLGFPLPKNGFFPVLIHRIIFLWNCVDCSLINQEINVVAHPQFGGIFATDWPDNNLLTADGGTTTVCPRIVQADLDIKPGSCPNAFNIKLFEFAEDNKPKKGGLLPVAIVGTMDFDVNDIDVSTVLLEGVAPLTKGSGIRDVTRPADDTSDCGCTLEGPDGIDDLQLKFISQQIAAAIAPGIQGDRLLTLTGQLLDGTEFEASDCIRIVGRATPPIPMPSGPVLNRAVPNPFNPTTRISYVLPESESVSLAVYDVSGSVVAVLERGFKGAGEHVVEWDASNMASGVYFIRLKAGQTVEVKRVTLLK
jgi:hypothetical protein